MSEMEEKLGAILNNPQLMQQVMSMAQSLGQSAPSGDPKPPEHKEENAPSFTLPDPAVLQKLSGFAGGSSIDSNQKALLCALGPYLSHSRIAKLEKAMRAARMAQFASSFLGQGGLSLLTGR